MDMLEYLGKMFSFLWIGRKENKKSMALFKWKRTVKTKEIGG